jgi:hypothetical protein
MEFWSTNDDAEPEIDEMEDSAEEIEAQSSEEE